MALLDLNADNIGDLDEGRAKALINHALATLMKDLDDRGDDEKTRVLTIKLTFAKLRGNAIVDVQVAATTPAYRSNNTHGKLCQKKARDGVANVFAFQEVDGENVDQETFDFDKDNDKRSDQ